MIVFFLLIIIVLIGLTTAAVLGRFGGFLAEPTNSQAFGDLPPGSLSSGDLGGLRFDQALRGYRMDQVDKVIDALSARLREVEADAARDVEADADPSRAPEPE